MLFLALFGGFWGFLRFLGILDFDFLGRAVFRFLFLFNSHVGFFVFLDLAVFAFFAPFNLHVCFFYFRLFGVFLFSSDSGFVFGLFVFQETWRLNGFSGIWRGLFLRFLGAVFRLFGIFSYFKWSVSIS